MGVSAASASARGNRDVFAIMRKIGDVVKRLLRLRIELAHDCTHGHLQDQILTALAVAARPLTVRAALSTKMVLETIVDQRGKLRRSLNNHVAATPAIAAIGTALGNVGLAPKGHATSTAVAAFDVDTADIGKLRHRMPFS